jgi:hypothetical protein
MSYHGVSKFEPIIQIDSSEAEKVERDVALRKIYYQPSGYFRTAEKLHTAIKKAGYGFSLEDVRDWLHKQAVWQIHAPPPRYIPRVSFNNITVPNEAHMCDLLPMPHDKVGNKIYKHALCIIDVASRYKWVEALTSKNSKEVADTFEKIYNNPKCLLIWPKILLPDRGAEFLGEVKALMIRHGVKHKPGTGHRNRGLVKRLKKTVAEWAFIRQDASDLLLPLSERSRAWVKNLPVFRKSINNEVTRLIDMKPSKAMKMKHVYAKSSQPRDGPIGFDEEKLTYNDSVRYLLEPGELEGGRRRATDMYWSPQIYHIKETLVQKNQPVLYWLEDDEGNGPERSFVREELMVIPDDTELPPKWVLKN